MSGWISKDKALNAVIAEEELSDEIPLDLLETIRRGDRASITELLRIIVRTTKKNILERIAAL